MLYQNEYKFWFCPGSVDLYGDEEIRIVTEHYMRSPNRVLNNRTQSENRRGNEPVKSGSLRDCPEANTSYQ